MMRDPSSPTLTNPDMILPHESPNYTKTELPNRLRSDLPSPPHTGDAISQSFDQSTAPSQILGRSNVIHLNDEKGGIQIDDGRSVGQSGNTHKVPQSSNGAIADEADTYGDSSDLELERPDIVALGTGMFHTEDEDEDDAVAQGGLSEKAEETLANAKEILLKMETNLSRARSMRSPQTPPAGYGPQSGWGISPAKHRQLRANEPPSKSGHSRILSETSVPSSMQTIQQEAHDKVEGIARENGRTALRIRDPSSSGRHNSSLEPLHEDGPAPETFDDSPPEGNRYITDESQWYNQDTAFYSLDDVPGNGLGRSRSSMQMRDIRDHMTDLKGKISTLKERAHADSLKRRSLQSLRTPSPFTAAKQWYTNGNDVYQLKAQEGTVDEGPDQTLAAMRNASGEPKEMHKPENTQVVKHTAEDLDALKYDEQEQVDVSDTDHPINRALEAEDNANFKQSHSNALGEDDHSSARHTDSDHFESEGPEPVTSPSSKGPRHEDRPDAFDYEHYFLHSAMGNYSRKPELTRTGSRDSSSSAETTKPNPPLEPVAMPADAAIQTKRHGAIRVSDPSVAIVPGVPPTHLRQNSVDSATSAGTFVSAVEGSGESHEMDSDEELHQKRPMAGSWLSEASLADVTPRVSTIATESNGLRNHSNKSVSPTNTADNANAFSTLPSSPLLPREYSDIAHVASSTGSVDTILALLGNQDGNNSTPRQSQTNVEQRLSLTDRTLVEQLVGSLLTVCTNLRTEGQDVQSYDRRVWRRRLDTARRMLDGEIGEVEGVDVL